jgi:hypothetical protein
MSSANRSRKRSPRDRERDIRRTRTEGARRVLRARHATDVRDNARSFGRLREHGRRSFPGRSALFASQSGLGASGARGLTGPPHVSEEA